MSDLKTTSTVAIGATTTGGMTQVIKQATILFTCIVNALLPYIPVELHGYAADLLRFNERFPILILLPIVVAVGYVVASVSGLERAFAEIGKAILIVLFTVGPIVALSSQLTLIGACVTTLVFYAAVTFLIDRVTRSKPAIRSEDQVVSYRR